VNDDMQSLAQVKQELGDKIEAVDRKVDQTRVRLEGKIEAVDRRVEAVDRKIDQTRSELSTLVTATATALEHRMDRKLDQKLDQKLGRLEQRLVKAADDAVERVLGTVYERFSYDAGALADRLDAQQRELDRHVADDRIHHTHGDEPG
jgi:chromosome segregation ATPase